MWASTPTKGTKALVGADAYIRPKNIPNRDDVGIDPYAGYGKGGKWDGDGIFMAEGEKNSFL